MAKAEPLLVEGLAVIGRALGIEALRLEIADLRSELDDFFRAQIEEAGFQLKEFRRLADAVDEIIRRRTRTGP